VLSCHTGVPTRHTPARTVAAVTSQRGQASVEWVALMLLVALGLGALLTGAREVQGSALGDDVAHRIACAAGGACRPTGAPGAGSRGDPPPRESASIAPPRVVPAPVRGGGRELLRAGAKKAVALNGLLCYLRKSTASGDTNRVGDDVGDAVNCFNPVGGWTGDVGGTDD
jgi:hypothetical protein